MKTNIIIIEIILCFIHNGTIRPKMQCQMQINKYREKNVM